MVKVSGHCTFSWEPSILTQTDRWRLTPIAYYKQIIIMMLHWACFDTYLTFKNVKTFIFPPLILISGAPPLKSLPQAIWNDCAPSQSQLLFELKLSKGDSPKALQSWSDCPELSKIVLVGLSRRAFVWNLDTNLSSGVCGLDFPWNCCLWKQLAVGGKVRNVEQISSPFSYPHFSNGSFGAAHLLWAEKLSCLSKLF